MDEKFLGTLKQAVAFKWPVNLFRPLAKPFPLLTQTVTQA